MATNWKKVSDRAVRHHWKCPDPMDEGCKEKAIISPDWYENNGTPICIECDCDMEYVKTEVKTSK